MKTLVDILTIVFVVLMVVLVVSAVLCLGASIEHSNPFAYKDMDIVAGASFLLVVFLAIVLSFYEAGKKTGGVEALRRWSEEDGEEETT